MTTRDLTAFTRNGFPWDDSRPAFHATAALSSIVRTGFKVRKEVGHHVTGGGTDVAVSLTLDPRVAEAITIGLDTIRKIATHEYGWKALYELAKHECPKGVKPALDHWTEDDIDRLDAGLRLLGPMDKGWLRWTMKGGPASAIRDEQRAGWWIPSQLHPSEWTRRDALTGQDVVDFYKRVLAFGDSEKECWDPLFFLTDIAPFRKIRRTQIGVLETRLHFLRVCTGLQGAYSLGFLTRGEVGYVGNFLDDEVYHCEREVEEAASDYPYARPYKMYMQPLKIGPYDVLDEGLRRPQDTVVYLGAAMSEIRAYSPRQIEVRSAITIDEVRELRNLGEHRITYPWFRPEPLQSWQNINL